MNQTCDMQRKWDQSGFDMMRIKNVLLTPRLHSPCARCIIEKPEY
jgi:hypothetical protein